MDDANVMIRSDSFSIMMRMGDLDIITPFQSLSRPVVFASYHGLLKTHKFTLTVNGMLVDSQGALQDIPTKVCINVLTICSMPSMMKWMCKEASVNDDLTIHSPN